MDSKKLKEKVQDIFETTVIVIISAVVLIVLVGLIVAAYGLVFWGIGSFICWVFRIPFHWTFGYGVLTCIIAGIVAIIKDCWRRDKK